MKKIIIVVVIALAVVGVGIVLFLQDNKAPTLTAQPIVTNDFSRVPNDSQLLGNLQKAKLDALKSEGTAIHTHEHLDIIVNGKAVAVPADIGVATNFISPIHTHDSSGILHIESPDIKDFKLSQFFTEWGITFDNTRIGENTVDFGHRLVVGVNGSVVSDPQNLILKPHDEIEIWYGDSVQTPSLIKSFNFPEGL